MTREDKIKAIEARLDRIPCFRVGFQIRCPNLAVKCIKLGSRKHKHFYPVCKQCASLLKRYKNYPLSCYQEQENAK